MASSLTAIGLMSGASLRGVDAVLLTTDGEARVEPLASLQVPYSRDMKIWLRRAVKAAVEGRDGAADIGKAAGEVTLAHVEAVEALLDKAGVRRKDVDVIGFHGHTILHRPAHGAETVGRTWQLGDGAVLAEETKIDVVSDFRAADVQAGGEGAPLTPVYYSALVSGLAPASAEPPDGPVGVIDLGDAARVTFAPQGARGLDLVAFDSGPALGLLDDWTRVATGAPMDDDGAFAREGKVHTDVLRMMLLNPYMRRKPPKTLGRYDFKLDVLRGLTPEDGAATLTAFTAACIRQSERFLPEAPALWIACGAGRRNAAMIEALSQALAAPVMTAEAAGWRGDDLEAECFAYLAVRSLKKLPLSYPKTTRAPAPMRGGVFHKAPV